LFFNKQIDNLRNEEGREREREREKKKRKKKKRTKNHMGA